MSQAELNGELFTLERFPPNAEEEALQAWEAADEYLLQQVNDCLLYTSDAADD